MTRSHEATATIVLNSFLGVQRGMFSKMPNPPVSVSTLEEQLKRRRPELARQLFAPMLANAALTYQGLSDPELERYLALVKSPSGRRFNEVVIQSLDRVLSEAAEYMGRDIADLPNNLSL